MTKHLPAIRRRASAADEIETDAAKIGARLSNIKTLLAGTNPATQAAVLADLVAVFVAGHHPSFREQLMAHHMQTVRDLIPLNERALFDQGFPAGWPAR